MNIRLLPIALLALAACESTADTDEPDTTTATGPVGCARDVVEEDLAGQGPIAGPNVDPETGELVNLPASFVVSTTYLALKEGADAQKRFGELVGPIAQSLGTQPGLLAVELVTSPSCGTARTRTLWKDEAAMYTFSGSDAHRNAADNVGEVSRGTSMVHHWTATKAEEATWEFAAKKLGEEEGPFY